jgi:hypothetical protein
MKKIVLISSISLLMQSCVAAPVNPPMSNPPNEFSSRFSIEGIKQRREAEYAQKLIDLKKLNPADEVKKALKINNIYLLAYQSGKGGSTITPGLVEPQALKTNCKVHQLDGMGDAIYGENHLRYRVALREYASKFNALMSPHCR